uniref:TGF-beta family profile domain-containing protein n=1 Tax=Romanomermis culicivorax TaxID=13658 RepID=A0A915JUY1_ROMCU
MDCFSKFQRESGEKLQRAENVDPESQPTCGLRGWPVDLGGLLHQRLMMPKRVNVNYCSGVCPFPVYDSHWNATNNAVIRSSFIYVRGQMTQAYVPDPLCVPRTLNSMSFLFSENNNIIVRILEQVVATSCMCA